MKRAGDSSYNISDKRMGQNEAVGARSAMRSTHSEVDSAFKRNQSISGNAKTFYQKRLSNNPNYKNASNMSRAASAIDAPQMRNTTSAFNAKLHQLDRANRSGAHKNNILLQSHYGLSGNNSGGFGFAHIEYKAFRRQESTDLLSGCKVQILSSELRVLRLYCNKGL